MAISTQTAVAPAAGDETLAWRPIASGEGAPGKVIRTTSEPGTGTGGAGGTLYGSGVPGGGLGADGETYFDVAGMDFYGPKAAGDWGSATPVLPQIARILTALDAIETAGGAPFADVLATFASIVAAFPGVNDGELYQRSSDDVIGKAIVPFVSPTLAQFITGISTIPMAPSTLLSLRTPQPMTVTAGEATCDLNLGLNWGLLVDGAVNLAPFTMPAVTTQRAWGSILVTTTSTTPVFGQTGTQHLWPEAQGGPPELEANKEYLLLFRTRPGNTFMWYSGLSWAV